MPSSKSHLRGVEVALAVVVLALVAMTVKIVPGIDAVAIAADPIPSQYVPYWAVLFAPPTALAVASLAGALLDGLTVGSIASAALAVFTLLMVVWSGAALVFPSDGGVFFGHLFVALGAIALAVVVLVRAVVAWVLPADRSGVLDGVGGS